MCKHTWWGATVWDSELIGFFLAAREVGGEDVMIGAQYPLKPWALVSSSLATDLRLQALISTFQPQVYSVQLFVLNSNL